MTQHSPDPITDPVLQAPTVEGRLDGLRRFLRGNRPPDRRGTNLHVHCDHSFSVFPSATAAVAEAVRAGVEVLGLNDFFTTAGGAEFHAACQVAQMPGVLSLECIAMDREAQAAGTLLNDPANPGKVYLCGKGVTQPDEAEANRQLAGLRAHQERRNRALVARADAQVRARLGGPGPTWQDVVGQTPAGNTTERHVARAIQLALRRLAAEGRDYAADFTALVGDAPRPADADQQNQIRGHLLKAGKPCYEPEDPAAFPAVSELRGIFLRLGAVPFYPVLGDPVTSGEQDIPALFDRIAAWGFHAVELIPARNTEARVAAVLAEAAKRQWPVCDGTEHNTAAMEPMLTRWGMDERFRPRFREGALVLLGHQSLHRKGAPGYVDEQGRPRPHAYATCLAEGARAYDAVRKRTVLL
jgi:hypothetical protein